MKAMHISICLITLASCNHIDYEYIKKKIWNYDSGYRVGKGDFILFKSDQNLFKIKKDTIYYENRAVALITKLDKKLYNLTIKSIESNEIGLYRNDEESLK